MRNKGLWFGTMRVEAEVVGKAHRKPCCVCGKVPTKRRLLVSLGSGRSQLSVVYCKAHGYVFIQRRVDEGRRIRDLMMGEMDGDCVRLPAEPGDPAWVQAQHRKAAEARKKAKEGKA